jgi:predicted DNA-binding protein
METLNNIPDRSRPKTVSFRLPESLMEELRNLAKLNRRTLSGEVQIALEKHLQNNGSLANPSQDPPPAS